MKIEKTHSEISPKYSPSNHEFTLQGLSEPEGVLVLTALGGFLFHGWLQNRNKKQSETLYSPVSMQDGVN